MAKTGGIREFARHCGRDVAMISRYASAAQDGRLCGALVGTDGQRKLLDFELADQLLEAHNDPGENGGVQVSRNGVPGG
ncbi:MAG: hypothetical protein ACR2RB_11660 [Gammaproteobacteria bacterium]